MKTDGRIGCAAMTVLFVAIAASVHSLRLGAAMFGLFVLLCVVRAILVSRERRRPAMDPPPVLGAAYREDPERLVAYARHHFERWWSSDRFEVLSRRRSRTWWGREDVTFEVDVGWERATLTIVLAAGNGWLVRLVPTEKPGAVPLSSQDALGVARTEALRRGYTWREPVRVTRDGRTWVVATNVDMIGCNAHFSVDVATGVVLSHSFRPR